MLFETLPKFKALKLEQRIFLRNLAPAVIRDQEMTGICAALTAAQAILESGWGLSGLTLCANNLFGVKGTYKGHSYRCRTKEYSKKLKKMVTTYANFKYYPSWAESLADHSALFYRVSNYKKLRGLMDWEAAVDAVFEAGYATDDKYIAKLRALILAYRLDELVHLGGAPTVPRTYTVRAGDSLWRIAAQALGDGRRWPEIVKTNGLITNTIQPGQVLVLPEG